MHLSVADIVDAKVAQLTPKVLLTTMVSQMAQNRWEAVVIVSGQRPIGILTERDVVRLTRALLMGELPHDVTVGVVMSQPPFRLKLNTSVEDALNFCDRHHIRHAVVVNDAGELCGLLSQGALLRAHAKLLAVERESLGPAIAKETRRLRRQTLRLEELASKDALTQVGNRLALEAELQALEKSRREEPCALLMLDLDKFKAFNDHYGHLAGDEALRQVAHALKEGLREPDRVFRYGGEEFVVLLRHTDQIGAVATAERLVHAVAALGLHHEASPSGVMTVSAGVAEVSNDAPLLDSLERADEALYAAKQAGRNRVHVK